MIEAARIEDLPSEADKRVCGPALVWWNGFIGRFSRLPGRADFGPEDLTARALPHVILCDIAPDAATVRYRLVGTNHVNFTQRDFTGATIDELYPKGSPLLAYMRASRWKYARQRIARTNHDHC